MLLCFWLIDRVVIIFCLIDTELIGPGETHHAILEKGLLVEIIDIATIIHQFILNIKALPY